MNIPRDPATATDYSDLPFASKTLFESEVVQIGATRCPVEHPEFHDPGPIQRHVFYLGGTPVRVSRPSGAAFVGDATTVSFHNQGDEVYRESEHGPGDFSNWFSVAPDWLLRAISTVHPEQSVLENRPFRIARGPCPPTCLLAQRLLVGDLQRGAGTDRLQVEEIVLELLDAVLSAAYGAHASPPALKLSTARRHARIVEDVQELLAVYFKSPLDLREIARGVDTSPFHLARIFRTGTGWTLHGFRTQLRLNAALEAVLAGADDLTELAMNLGFSSHSHLTSAFTRSFGRSPTSVRQTARF